MLLLALALVEPAEACACCSEPDFFGQQTPDSATFSELNRLVFSEGRLVERTHEPVALPDSLAIRGTGVEPGQLTFTVSGPGRSQSQLTFSYVEAKSSLSQVDSTPYSATAPSDPSLYTQWVIPGSLAIEGPLSDEIQVTNAVLVLQGSGNFCVSAEMFYRWGLHVTGKSKEGEHLSLSGAGPLTAK